MLFPAYSYLNRDPFSLMRGMMEDLNPSFVTRQAPAFPAVNVWQGGDAVAITAELPGMEPSDVEITVKDYVLTLSGERKAPESGEGAAWHRRERSYGKFTRAIRLPFEADADKVEARFTNGVLHVVAGRPEKDQPRRIEIQAA